MDTNPQILEKAIEELAGVYKEHPDSYFSENELQYELYCMLKTSEEFNLYFKTNDGKDVKMVHPEYPSIRRVQLHKGKGYRVWFDLAILSPKFIKQNSYKTVTAKDERNAKFWGENLLAAFEFKFFPRKRLTDIISVKEDCNKLNLCPEITNRYVVTFSLYKPDLSEFKDFDLGETRLYWITPDGVSKLP